MCPFILLLIFFLCTDFSLLQDTWEPRFTISYEALQRLSIRPLGSLFYRWSLDHYVNGLCWDRHYLGNLFSTDERRLTMIEGHYLHCLFQAGPSGMLAKQLKYCYAKQRILSVILFITRRMINDFQLNHLLVSKEVMMNTGEDSSSHLFGPFRGTKHRRTPSIFSHLVENLLPDFRIFEQTSDGFVGASANDAARSRQTTATI